MKHDIKTRWVDALRSGEYKQAHGQLMIDNAQEELQLDIQPEFCCLGVLYDVVAGREAWSEGGIHIVDEDMETFNDGELPECLLKEYDLKYSDMQTLIKMNDGHRPADSDDDIPPQPFNVIADWIEENL